MPAQQIAQNLAYINWTVLVALGIGTFAALVVARERTDAPRGYLVFTALCAAGFAGLAWLSDSALPGAAGSAAGGAAGAAGAAVTARHVAPDPLFDQARAAGLAILAISALVWAIAVRRGMPHTRLPAISGLAGGGLTLAAAAGGWGGGIVAGLLLLLQLAVLSAASGGVFAAMILGHWYLVSPKLGERPLVLLSRLLFWTLGIQLVLYGAWVATGVGTGTSPFSALSGPWALFVWLRLIVGLLFPLVVSWAAIQTARSRSMESATGLLYINVGTIAAGTILAAGLYFGAGLLT